MDTQRKTPRMAPWTLATLVLSAGALAAGWSVSAQVPEPGTVLALPGDVLKPKPVDLPLDPDIVEVSDPKEPGPVPNPGIVPSLLGDVLDPKPGELPLENDLVALSFPTTSPRANIHGDKGLFSKASVPTAYDVCLAQFYGGTLGTREPYTQTGRIALRTDAAEPFTKVGTDVPAGHVACSAASLDAGLNAVLEPTGKETSLATGFHIGLQGQLGRSNGVMMIPVPGTVEWQLATCSTGGTTFEPSLKSPDQARAVQSCGGPVTVYDVGQYVQDLAGPDFGTGIALPRLEELVEGSSGSQWVVSCVRLDAMVLDEGTITYVGPLVAHDWFMALDPADPLLPAAVAMALDSTRTYDRSGGNGCPVPMFSASWPNPALPCLPTWMDLNGVADPEAAGAEVPRFIGAAEISVGLGAGRALTANSIDAPSTWLATHTTNNELGIDSWQVTPNTPGLHRVNLEVATECLPPFSGTPEVFNIVVDVLVPGNRCPLWRPPETAATLQFLVDLSPMPTGIAVGSDFHFGTVTSLHDTYGLGPLGVEVASELYSLFAREVTALAELKYCLHEVPVVEFSAIPNDSLYDPVGPPPVLGQWGMKAVGMEPLWDHGFEALQIDTCIADTDFNPGFEDFDTARFAMGHDVRTGVSSTSADDLWHGFHHGTAVASVALGDTNDNWGMAGAAEADDFYFAALGSPASVGNILDGVEWCLSQSVNIISLSAVIPTHAIPDTLRKEVADHFSGMLTDVSLEGALLVAAVGNNFCPNMDCVAYPARFAETHTIVQDGMAVTYPGKGFVIAVGCTDQGNAQCDWTSTSPGRGSSEGDAVTVVAPGDNILVVHDGCPVSGIGPCSPCPQAWDPDEPAVFMHCYDDGTSFSTPLVAGVAALIWSLDPTLPAADVRHYIECTADDLTPVGAPVDPNDHVFGWGLLDADQAWDAVTQATCTPDPCFGTAILEPDGTPVDAGDSFYGNTVFTAAHSSSHHLTHWTFVTSDGAEPLPNTLGHDQTGIFFGDAQKRTVTATAHYGTPEACTASATWQHTN